ncbi:malonyl-CoA decarboxylase [Hoeflea sp. WL0058]|uniref:Malonyl-CoA decarboxylase n=1 Tax=Flavimaribacter sediminis TaxID=2865987 RepID=A0AAE2ZGZ6_9HYPH|nr:malonyl-CoA decarboxylase [Flavimaribacter sediminis]MBW8635939.1 malonyl-CoA decarboxylase [Flavimaribacter sediminis]
MTRSNFLADLLSSVFERGQRRFVSRDSRSIEELCKALLSESGESSGTRLAGAILDRYAELDDEARKRFFALLVEEYDIDTDKVAAAATRYGDSRDGADLAILLEEAEPKRQELLRRVNRAPGATGQLVRMRADLLSLLKENPEFRRADIDFDHLFASWFNRGFLVLRHIDWMTPANILEKIIEYEAVHAIDDWEDLRRRLAPEDRRCFAFFHPSMPDEPLIFVEVALATGIPGSIQDVLSEDRKHVDEDEATAAVFYSISNCQKGLAGVSFGNFLIKQVATDLKQSLPNLKTFVTLSPVPGFNDWLRGQAALDGDEQRADRDEILAILEAGDGGKLSEYSTELTRLAAEYVCLAKRPDGRPADPVARFHLGNGARLERINPQGDLSRKGLAASSGVMVNYLYDLNTVEDNHEAYAHNNEVIVARPIRALLRERPGRKTQRSSENA